MNTVAPHPIGHAGTAFRFKKFQLEDYARMGLHNGAVLGHDTGGGKGLAVYVLPALKCGFERGVKGLKPNKPVLIVAPGDLHQQIMDEGRLHFKAVVTPVDSQATFQKLARVNPAGGAPILPPGYYLTSYTQLASNGVTEFPKYDPANWLGLMHQLGLNESHAIEFFNRRGQTYQKLYDRLNLSPELATAAGASQLKEAWQMTRSGLGSYRAQTELDGVYQFLQNFTPPIRHGEFNDLTDAQQEFVLKETTAHLWREYSGSIGATHWFKHKAGVTRIAGRIGEPQEFVEFQDGDTRIVAQANPAGEWGVYKCVGESVEVLKMFPEKRQAVPFAEAQTTGQVEHFKIKCVYSPTLADLCQDSFEAVAVDEGVRMKGEETEVGLGVRQMNPKYRFVLSATPIKNRLPDAFRLAWWATGALPEAHARWPYPDSSSAREEFATEFLISERNLTKEQKSETNRRYLKLTPQVCNVHRLWKLFAPVILRRRKRDFGEDIVTKTRHVVRVPMGAEQAAVYKFHLDAKYRDKNGLPAIGAQLQALRIAAANPCSTLLGRPTFDHATKGEPRSRSPHIPKLHAAFKLISQILTRGEQCVVFSAFHDSLDALSARLQESGVKHCVLDGRTSQKKRAALAAQFKLGPPKAGGKLSSPYSLMLAGVECMAEGHSFPLCNNVILLCYSWAYDKFEQAINRVHRLNSRWPVNVYPIICDGSIDRKLEALIQEKGDAAELVLDGKLMAEHSAEVNLAELLHTARVEFAGKVVVNESELEKEWPALRTQLGKAMQSWNRPWLQVDGSELTVESQVPTAPTQPSTRFQITSTCTTPPPPASEIRPVVVAPVRPRPAVLRPAVSQTSTFDGMPLFAQSAGLPRRPLPFAKKK